MDINNLLDQAKGFSEISSDAKLAKRLGISGAAISKWRNDGFFPTPDNAQQLAELAGIDPAPIVIEILLQAAQTANLRSTLTRFKSLIFSSITMITALGAVIPYCILCKIGIETFRMNQATT